MNYKADTGSFRDPSGRILHKKNKVYRTITDYYKEDYEHLIKSGLYKKLVKLSLLIPHTEVKTKFPNTYKLINPIKIPFVSYPYEWSFSQLKDAALLTLKVQKIAFEHGMILKDASAYNVQIYQGKPILIDTLSFEIYQKNMPWVGYRQFCQHFLSPLLLMAVRDLRLNKLTQSFLDGVPLDLASRLLPLKTWINLPILIHIHIQSRLQNTFGGKRLSRDKYGISTAGLMGLGDNLEKMVQKINHRYQKSFWSEYYKTNSYSHQGIRSKEKIVIDCIQMLRPKIIWDMGSNTGEISRKITRYCDLVVAFDNDPVVVEQNYAVCRKEKITNCIPLVVDLCNPSPAIGWENTERLSFFERGPADTLIALALIHHLVIANNIPFEKIASTFQRLGNNLIIEFVPPTDPQSQRLMANRERVFSKYDQEEFELVFGKYFKIIRKIKIPSSPRSIYVMRSRKKK